MEWITKRSNNYAAAKSDVVIVRRKSNNDRAPRYGVRFKNGKHLSITNNKKIMYAFTNSRIYFNQCNENNGFTLSDFSVDNRTCCMQITRLNDDFIGDYMLEYDAKEKLYYIDLEKKI